MTIKPGLAASLTGNALLVVLASWMLVHRSPAPSVAPPAAAAVHDPTEVTRAAVATADVDEGKVLALARLETAIATVALTDFWKPDADQDVTRRMDAIELQRERIRAELIARYGAAAAEDPAFARMFRPLDARYPYLSSKSQLALLKLQRARRGPVGAAPLLVRGDGLAPDLGAAGRQQQEFERGVRAALTPAEWQEYQLRESGAARQLRASGVAGDEHQFREVFRVLEQVELDQTVAGYVDAQEKLAAILGVSQYAKFSAARDPAYGALQAAATRHGLTPQQLDGVYAAVLNANNKFARLSMNHGTQEATAPNAETQQVLDQRQGDVARLVGDAAAAADLIDAYMNQLMTAPHQSAAL
jgi:hypothetical protein